MTTTPDDTATTWRELESELTFDQVGQLLNFESKAKGDPVAVAESLLSQAREHVQKNKVDGEKFSHLPLPAGAERVYHWEDDGEGNWTRLFAGLSAVVERPLPEYRNYRNMVEVGIDGVQYSDGSTERMIHIHSDGTSFTTANVRELVEYLTRMADEIDRLGG